MKANSIERIITGVIGGLFVAYIGHFVGQNTAIAIVGGWVFMGLRR